MSDYIAHLHILAQTVRYMLFSLYSPDACEGSGCEQLCFPLPKTSPHPYVCGCAMGYDNTDINQAFCDSGITKLLASEYIFPTGYEIIMLILDWVNAKVLEMDRQVHCHTLN